ncbi:guanylate kinase [Mariprofundus ferrooxydans]|uniref:Guanylate kinase n=1 Tax=Mariprofundus ferrooxydans PV-1 TaxID=314345 RepID=Q0F2G8_9PROT|nr:guanylate kinase [Mariprofundus ferrooxydans]EAU55582.1 guanylate kinase [Mariprofundus ferrooxydans PV-1]KON48679.1 guanylate kinase [Mariprofundus ferrooxydans]
MSGRLFIVSGPSGAGKSSLCTALLSECPDLKLSISCTTRQPRPGEMDGREYHFLSVSDFECQRERGDFLEWANVHGNLYGTRQSDVEAQLQGGYDVLLEIDWQGARQVAEKMPGAIRIFILPPSLDELRSRLAGRGQDDAATVNRRMAAAEMEMSHADEATYRVVNIDFKEALAELRKFFS